MFLAALFILLTGLVWMTISVTQASARHVNCPAELYYAIGSTVAFTISAILLLCSGKAIPEQWSWMVLICTVFATVTNSVANITTMINVGYGGAALYLALSTLGFVISFLWSVIVWHEPMSVVNAIGMVCLASAVVLSSLNKKGDVKVQQQSGDMRLARKRLLLALCSTVACGVSQILFVYPFSSKFNAPPLPQTMKIAIIMLTYIPIYWGIFLFRLKRHQYGTLPHLRTFFVFPLTWGVIAVISYSVLFTALRLMGEIGRAGLTYAMASAVQIFLFALFCLLVYRDKLTPRQLLALVLIVIGIFTVQR